MPQADPAVARAPTAGPAPAATAAAFANAGDDAEPFDPAAFTDHDDDDDGEPFDPAALTDAADDGEPFDAEAYFNPFSGPPEGEDAWLARVASPVADAYLADRQPRARAREVLAAGFTHKDHERGAQGFAAGGPLDTMEPGAVLAGFADDAIDDGLNALSDDELIGLMGAARRLASRAAGIELAAVAGLDARRAAHARAVNDWRQAEHVADEVAVALTLTCRAADKLLDLANGVTRLPAVTKALAAGRIDLPRATVFVRELAGLGDVPAAAIAAVTIADAAKLTTGELGEVLRSAVLAHDPEAARKRREKALKDARVETWAESRGTAALAGRDLPPAAVLAADAHVDGLARQLKAAGVAGALEQLRARVFLALLTSQPLYTLLPGHDTHDPDEPAGDGGPDGDGGGPDGDGGGPGGDADGSSGNPGGPADGGSPDRHGNGRGGADGNHGGGGPGTGSEGRDGSGRPGHGAGSPDRHGPGSRDASRSHADGDGERPGEDGEDDNGDGDGDGNRGGGDGNRGGGDGNRGGGTRRPGPGSGPYDGWPAPGTGLPLPPGLAGSVHLTLPLATWLGLSGQPGEAAGHGPLDADTSRGLAARLAANPGNHWCLTILDNSGRAIGHGCARAGPGPPRPGPPGPGRDPREWLAGVTIRWLETGACGHARQTFAYRPSPALRHLIKTRDRTCTYPGCRWSARRCDDDHTVPFDQGGRTCECNLAPLCRRHHAAKQAPGWHLWQRQPGHLTWALPSGRTKTVTPRPYCT